MPDMQSSTPAAVAPSSIDAAISLLDESDFAFGCECADPALQIPQWGQDAGLAPDGN
jgi:hypothetical protein